MNKLIEEATQMGIEIPEEMFDFIKIMIFGAKKYDPNGWLKPDGFKCQHKGMHDSMFHHLAESFTDQRVDPETGLDPLLHLATRALMCYTRKQRNLDGGYRDDV